VIAMTHPARSRGRLRSASIVRRPLAALLSTALLSAGCASAPAKVPIVGRTVTVRTGEADQALKGELLLVGKDSLWLRGEDGVREVSLAGVRTVRVQQHSLNGKKAWTWAGIGAAVTGGGLAASCGSVEGSGNCAAVGLVAGGLWLLVGALAAPSLERSSRIELKAPTVDALRPYARLPQGLPAGLSPRALAPAPPESKERSRP
jgi:hypothetical protein